jgi:hypothetical protein
MAGTDLNRSETPSESVCVFLMSGPLHEESLSHGFRLNNGLLHGHDLSRPRLRDGIVEFTEGCFKLMDLSRLMGHRQTIALGLPLVRRKPSRGIP